METETNNTDLPEIDLQAHEAWKKQNFQERLVFIDWYADWLKKNGKVVYK